MLLCQIILLWCLYFCKYLCLTNYICKSLIRNLTPYKRKQALPSYVLYVIKVCHKVTIWRQTPTTKRPVQWGTSGVKHFDKWERDNKQDSCWLRSSHVSNRTSLSACYSWHINVLSILMIYPICGSTEHVTFSCSFSCRRGGTNYCI